MKKLLFALLLACAACSSPDRPGTAQFDDEDVERWRARAARVTITRDDWGVPHIRAGTDADAVFGLMYAQAEDDFRRVEQNLLLAQGRLAEAEGEKEIWRDLRMRLFIEPQAIQAKYAESPEWLKALMIAWADGLNYYLYTHPEARPRVIARFEPWMALTFTEGSIGGDIERISLADLERFYGVEPTAAPIERTSSLNVAPSSEELDPTGSNGFAIAPSRSASGRALLWINPHTSFFFRTEAHVTSDESLNVYGALTWGQFFVYQGFNERAGWMHTSSGVDNIDEYAETVVRTPTGFAYRYGAEQRPVETRNVVVRYRTPDGMAEREFTVYRTHHGPVVREADGKWISVRLMEKPVEALMQSFLRTKAQNLAQFMELMNLHSNSSNNTVFADAEGNIAYLHANFIPVRDPRFDWKQPVDGADPATEWRGVHTVNEAPNVINPKAGWLYNTNDPPWNAAGPGTLRPEDYPSYVDRGALNPRGMHALRVLGAKKTFTPDELIAAAFDRDMPAFDTLIPQLARAYTALPESDARRARLAAPIAMLRSWNRRWAADSVATTLAVLWAEELWGRVSAAASRRSVSVYEYMEKHASRDERLDALASVLDRLEQDFGRWRVEWGEINRLQRLTGDIEHPFSDAAPSIPVAFTPGRWGSLATFGARRHHNSRKLYGVTGNSFLAVVEFGEKVRAKAISVGGQSGDPGSPHFNDQSERYARGELREVYFYPEQLEGHTERVYHPGE